MSGQAVGSLIGSFWGPIGGAIGGLIGGALFPTRTKGPRLEELQQQSAQEGTQIPFGFGTFPCPTQLIWQGDVIEHENEEGGKGGPTTVTYTYTRSYAIGLCEGPITAVQKLWRNGKLVYDISPESTMQSQNAKFLEKCTIYLGDETQNVDPTIEAAEGVGETGPMRGLAYFVMEDDETERGEVAQWRAVVQMCGTVTNTDGSMLGTGPRFYYPMQLAIPCVDETGNCADLTSFGVLPDNIPTLGGVGVEFIEYARLQNTLGTGLSHGTSAHTVLVKACVTSDALGGAGGLRNILGAYNNAITLDCNWSITLDGANNLTPTIRFNNTTGAGTVLSAPFEVSVGQEFTVGFRHNSTLLELIFDGEVVASTACAANSNFVSTAFYVNGLSSGAGWVNFGFLGSVGEAVGWNRALTDGELMTATFLQDRLPPGYTAAPDAPGVVVDEEGNIDASAVDSQEVSSCGATLSDIVDALCERSGIDAATEVDSSQLTDFVKGYPCAAGGSAYDYLQPLMGGFFFDRGEWDKKIRFIKRGGASAFSLTTDDLIARDGAALGHKHTPEHELLRKVSVVTLDPAADYNMKPQSWERRIGTIQATGEETVQVPVVADADTTKQMAHKLMNVGWSEVDRLDFGVTIKHTKLTNTDVGTVTDAAGVAHRVRLSDTLEAGGVLMVEEAVRDRAAAYDSSAVGTVADGGGGGGAVSLVGPTLLAVLNLPQMRSQDGSGFYVGMCGILPGWAGAQLLMSVDGGVSYTVVLTVTRPTKMGHLVADCTSSSEPVQVRVYGGELASATTAQVAAGANIAALLSAGVAELMNFEDATATAPGVYDLETNTRGLRDTTAAAHVAYEQFVDIATSYFLPVSLDYLGQDLMFKAVGMGVSADAVEPITVTYEGLTLIHDGGEVAP